MTDGTGSTNYTYYPATGLGANKLRTVEQRAATVRGFARDLLPALADGRIKPLIDRVYSLDELPAAKARMESNAHVGKIVVRMGK